MIIVVSRHLNELFFDNETSAVEHYQSNAHYNMPAKKKTAKKTVRKAAKKTAKKTAKRAVKKTAKKAARRKK